MVPRMTSREWIIQDSVKRESVSRYFKPLKAVGPLSYLRPRVLAISYLLLFSDAYVFAFISPFTS